MVDSSEPFYGHLEAAAVSRVLASGQLWRGNGPGWGSQQDEIVIANADRLEDAIADRFGLPYVHAVNSGTSASEAAIASLGLSPGDEVICPAVAPVFVPFAIISLGCIPVFADTDPDTLLIDPAAIESVLSERTRAVVVVHLFGVPAPMDQIRELADKYRLRIVEDCAQALCSSLYGRPLGTFGDAACFSFQQTKHISSGEGGAVATRTAGAYARAVLYSNAGIPTFRFGLEAPANEFSDSSRGHLGYGHNHRISELQSAIVLAQLARLDRLVEQRGYLVQLIEEELCRFGNRSVSAAPKVPNSHISYWRYPITVPAGHGTFVGVAYLEPAFREIDRHRRTPFGVPIPRTVHYEPGTCPNAERGTSRVRVLALRHGMTEGELRQTMATLLKDFG